MRFSIYDRDGYRCKMCGRKTNDLEIDHIFHISKGGKSEYSNLQTLCRRCNANKSDFVTMDNVSSKYNYKKCPECGGALRLINGKYGKFYGCMNYPKCKYTEEDY